MDIFKRTFRQKNDEPVEVSLRTISLDKITSRLEYLTEGGLKVHADHLPETDYPKLFGSIFVKLESIVHDHHHIKREEIQNEKNELLEKSLKLKVQSEDLDKKLAALERKAKGAGSIKELDSALRANDELEEKLEELKATVEKAKLRLSEPVVEKTDQISDDSEVLHLKNELGIKEDEIAFRESIFEEANEKVKEVKNKINLIRSQIEDARIEISNDILKVKIMMKNTIREKKKKLQEKKDYQDPLKSYKVRKESDS